MLGGIKLQRSPLWISESGLYAVVAGPFPDGYVRSRDAESVEKAIKRKIVGELVSRMKTTRSDRYAKVRMKDLVPTHNEYGEICP